MEQSKKVPKTVKHRGQSGGSRKAAKDRGTLESCEARPAEPATPAKKSGNETAEAREHRAASAADLLEQAIGNEVAKKCVQLAENLVGEAMRGKPTAAKLVFAICDHIRNNKGSQNITDQWFAVMQQLAPENELKEKPVAAGAAPAIAHAPLDNRAA